MKFYRITPRDKSGSIIGYCTEETLPRAEKFFGKKKFWIREIPKEQFEDEVNELPAVFV